MNTDFKTASMAAMRRLPNYLIYLKAKRAKGVKFITSVAMSEELGLNAMVVKKDLQLARTVDGKPNVGFSVDLLIRDIENFLGYNNVKDAILVGAGQLGKVLLNYRGFKNYGLNIVAAFDVNADGKTEVGGKPVFDVKKLPDLVKRLNVHIGIITVPGVNAQEVCDKLVSAGIKGIWNFAPAHLIAPNDVLVKNEDLAASLAILSNQLKEIMKDNF